MLRRFFGVETVKRPKKKGSVKMSKHKFSMKKKTGRQKKHKGIFRPFKKIKKWKQMRSIFQKKE